GTEKNFYIRDKPCPWPPAPSPMGCSFQVGRPAAKAVLDNGIRCRPGEHHWVRGLGALQGGNMKKTVTSGLAAVMLGLAQIVGASHAIAQDAFPDKPVHLVIPFSAGGGSDGLARAIQNVIETDKLLPVPLVITNAEGASGAV